MGKHTAEPEPAKKKVVVPPALAYAPRRTLEATKKVAAKVPPPRQVVKKVAKARPSKAFKAAVLVICLVVGFGLSALLLTEDEKPQPGADDASVPFTRTPLTPLDTVETTPQVDPVPVIPLTLTGPEAARLITPLSDLAAGDRVLYDGGDVARPVCRFQRWADSAIERGSIVNAVIQCPGESAFETQTGFLTPVETLN